MERYSIYEAKAKLSAIIRAVKQQRQVCITERGRDVVWVVPAVEAESTDLGQRLAQLEASGLLTKQRGKVGKIVLGNQRLGALGRFLRERAPNDT